jgi:hypothetical protein
MLSKPIRQVPTPIALFTAIVRAQRYLMRCNGAELQIEDETEALQKIWDMGLSPCTVGNRGRNLAEGCWGTARSCARVSLRALDDIGATSNCNAVGFAVQDIITKCEGRGGSVSSRDNDNMIVHLDDHWI